MFSFLYSKIPQIDVTDVKKAIDKKEDIVLLDVRTPGEFIKSHIHGSINIPVEDIEMTIENIVPDKTKTVYVYCFSGSRSVIAVEQMITHGYKNVYDMKNGILAWRVKRLPLT